MREHINTAFSAFLAIILLLSISACATPKALEPVDWVDKSVERLPVNGKGAWARLTNKPLQIGQYTAQPSSAFTGGGVSTTTTDSTQFGVATDYESGKEIGFGKSSTNNEGSVEFHLSIPSGALAQIRCRQYLKSTSNEISGGSWGISQNTGYKASLTCKSKALSADWPQWGMNLETFEAAPFVGSLNVDGAVFTVKGSQATSFGAMGPTSSYEISQGDSVMALVDLNGDGQMSITLPTSQKKSAGLVGAAAVLMIAEDPAITE